MIFFRLKSVLAACLLLVTLNATAQAEPLRGPSFGVASNFGQGIPPGLMDTALAAGFRDFRDAVYWDLVEQPDGSFDFSHRLTRYPDDLLAAGAMMSITLNNGHPAYDDGHTPDSTEAVTAFARYAAATLARFPAIKAVELGNEFNSANFVSGPLRQQGLSACADAYAALAEAVRPVTQAHNIPLISGGVHSIPTGYLQLLTDRGAVTEGDHIALHPYDTPIEQLRPQLAVMRENPTLTQTPVHITELGSQNADHAPHILYRSYCEMALSGVARAVWYPLNDRGDGYVPLINRSLDITPTGQVAQFIATQLANTPVRDVSPDPFTFACLFNETTLVIWGAPRDFTILNKDVEVLLSPTGSDGADHSITEDRALVLHSKTPVQRDRDYTLGPQRRLADSFYQFPLIPLPHQHADTGYFSLHSLSPNGLSDLTPQPGQGRNGVPWTPYLGHPHNKDIRALSNILLPSGSATFPEAIVLRFTVEETRKGHANITLTPAKRSIDGIRMELLLNGETLKHVDIRDTLNLTNIPLSLTKGDTLDLIVHPGPTATGDVTQYRLTLEAPH